MRGVENGDGGDEEEDEGYNNDSLSNGDKVNRYIYIYNIYLLKSHIYIEYDTNSGYKWTPREVIDLYNVHVINNCEGPRTIYTIKYNTYSNIFFLVF